MCEELAADRRGFFARRATPSVAPHATIFVPFAAGDRLIARRLGALRPVGSPLTLPGRVGRFLGTVQLVPRRLTLRPAADDRLGLRLDADLVTGDTPLVALSLDLDARPRLDPATGTLRVALRADDLRGVRPRLAPGAAQDLAAQIRARLPSVARAVVSEDEIAMLARTSTDYLAGHIGSLLVDSGLLDPLGEVAGLTVQIPIVPVSRITLQSFRAGGGGLLVGVYTDLPVTAGVPAAQPTSRGAEVVQVRLSGDALAELGNRALQTGLLPRRYDDEMHPRKDGDFTPGFRWMAGPRPLKIFAWRLKSPCLRARIGADPVVRVEGGRLAVGIEHGEVEAVRGAALVRARVWLKRVGADAIRFTRRTIASARVSIGGAPLTGRIDSAVYRNGTFTVDLVAE